MGCFGISYIARCLINNKVYVGITSLPFNKRVNSHRNQSKHCKTKFYNAIRKHGFEAFHFMEVASARNLVDLYELEKMLITQYDSRKNGYNSTIGGDGITGYKFTKELVAECSILSKRRWAVSREKYIQAAKDAWARKTPEEREAHRERTTIQLREVAKLRRHKPRKPKPIRTKGKGWNMKIKTHCPSGHEYSPENTWLNPKGSRVCITCKRKTRNNARNLRHNYRERVNPQA